MKGVSASVQTKCWESEHSSGLDKIIEGANTTGFPIKCPVNQIAGKTHCQLRNSKQLLGSYS